MWQFWEDDDVIHFTWFDLIVYVCVHLCICASIGTGTQIFTLCVAEAAYIWMRESVHVYVYVFVLVTCTRILVQGCMGWLDGWEKKNPPKSADWQTNEKKELNKKEKKNPPSSFPFRREKIRWHMMWCMHLRRIIFFPFPFLALPHYITRIPPKWRSHYNNDTSNYIHTCECTMTEHTHWKWRMSPTNYSNILYIKKQKKIIPSFW